MPNVYMGRNSCYATHEHTYVSPGPMDPGHAAAHLLLHLRDLGRGWTYDHNCNRIPMTEDLFVARSRYLVKLCIEQLGPGEGCDAVERMTNYAVRMRNLPKWALEMANKYLVKVKTLIDFDEGT